VSSCGLPSQNHTVQDNPSYVTKYVRCSTSKHTVGSLCNETIIGCPAKTWLVVCQWRPPGTAWVQLMTGGMYAQLLFPSMNAQPGKSPQRTAFVDRLTSSFYCYTVGFCVMATCGEDYHHSILRICCSSCTTNCITPVSSPWCITIALCHLWQ